MVETKSMNMPKVSVIVPVYGVENYIERCARSLFEQTLGDIEYLFIDDCTPDNSIDVLKRVLKDYPLRENQVKIFKMSQNSGQAKVRKFGISQVTGEFTIHCDSDDWIDTCLYEKLYNKAKSEDADIVIHPFIETDGNKQSQLALYPYGNLEHPSNKMYTWENEGSLCNKLIKTTLYNSGIIYPQDNMGEDMCLIYQLIYFANKISIVDNVYYYIYRNPISITRTPTQTNIYRNFLQGCNNCRIVEKFYKQHNAIDRDTRKSLIRLKYSKREILRPIVGIRKYHKIWCKTFPEIDKGIFTDSALTFREKLKSLCIRLRLFPFPWSKCIYKE